MIWGGMVGTGTFEFDVPDIAEQPDSPSTPNADNSSSSGGVGMARSFMRWRRKGKFIEDGEDYDDAVYFLQLKQDNWEWSKPLLHGKKDSDNRPLPRTEHTACKTSTNEVFKHLYMLLLRMFR